jgi:hypothetical protein
MLTAIKPWQFLKEEARYSITQQHHFIRSLEESCHSACVLDCQNIGCGLAAEPRVQYHFIQLAHNAVRTAGT